MPIVSTGQLTVTDVSDTPVISLTNNSHQVATDAYGLNGNYFGCNTTIRIYLGNQEVSASWTITATPSSGVTGALDGRTYSVTDMTGDVGYVDFTASKFGWESISARFSMVKSKRGDAGQALLILPSTLGFTFVDGFPSPQTQAIAFSVLKNGVSGDVEWQVSEGASLITDTSEQGSMTGFMFGTSGTVVGEVAYMDVADMNNKNEVVVSATCDGVTASHVVMRLDAYTAEAGATRNEISQGVLASRPAGTAGEFYYATDTFELYQKISDSWVLSSNKTSVDSSGNIQGVSSGSGLSVANNTDSVIRAPGGGVYVTNTPTMTGRLKITLPQSWTNTMMRFTVEIYEYSTGYMCTLEIGGYNYAPGTSWVNVTARVIGGSNVEYPVYFGHDGTKCCIWIGAATNETWSYPQVRIRDFFAGYSNYARTQWESGWAISFDQTAIASGTGANQYSASVTDTLPGANWAKISGTNKPADGATRNVFQGDWVSGTSYSVGDVVVKDGYSWTCKVATSSAAPPTYPTTSNNNWGMSGEKGDSALAVVMPNDTHTLPASSAGVVSSYTGSGTTIEVMDGSTKLSASSTATTSAFRITGTTVSPASSITVGAITYSGTAATVAAHFAMGNSDGTVQIAYNITAYRANGTAVNLTKVQTLTKSKEGAAGQNATSYWLMSSAAAVQKSIAGAYTPTSVTFSIQSATGTSAPTVYAGRFIIATSTDGSTYTDQYTSSANESSKAYTIPASIKTIRVRAYLAGGTTTLLDELITTVVSDGANGSSGASAVVAILSNEAHVFPAASDGTVGSYAGSGTKIRVYEGATELAYDGVGTSNSTWKIASSATNITVGTVTDSGSYASVGVHSGVAAGTDTSSITYTLTGKTAAGTAFSITKDQTFTKAKAGSNGSKGDTGAQGPSVIVTASRAASFTSTDGTLDASQSDIVFTATVSGVTSPTYSWTFSGLQTNPTTASTTSTQTITAAQFGNSKSATVTCTVSSTYKDVVTIVRLEKSTAAAGATVGAPIGTYVGGTLAQTVESNASTALSTANAANNAVGNKLDKASSEILSVATTGTVRVAGLRAGNLVWDASGNRTSGKGVAITPSGILGHNGTKSTFAINATTGDATFGGTLSADAVNAVSTVNIAGSSIFANSRGYMTGEKVLTINYNNQNDSWSQLSNWVAPGIVKNHSGTVQFVICCSAICSGGGASLGLLIQRATYDRATATWTFYDLPESFTGFSIVNEWTHSYSYTAEDVSPTENAQYIVKGAKINDGGTIKITRLDFLVLSGKR